MPEFPELPPELRATAYGFLNCAGTLVGGTVAFAAGTLKATFGLSVMLELAGALLVSGALILLKLGATPVEGQGHERRAEQRVS